MSKNIRNNVLAVICTFALLFAAAVVVEAQTDNPIFDDELVASIQDGDTWWIVPVSLVDQLELHLGEQATIETMSQLLTRLPLASSVNDLRFEGGYPSVSVSQDLDTLGYVTQSSAQTASLPGAGHAYVRTA